MIDFRELIKAGVHFGHMSSRWCPDMKPYIWGLRNKIHLIDVSKTAHQLEKASEFLKSIVASGKPVLWVGTKKAAQDIIRSTATELDMPYVNHRWIGGTLSNFSQVKKSITKLLHYEDVVARSEKFPHYTKKEIGEFQKHVFRLEKNIGGIRNMTWPIGALVLVDVTKGRSALQEAAKMGVPVIAIVDTNGDPSFVDYVIPANDDAPRSIKVIIDYLAKAAQDGKALADKKEEERAIAEAEGVSAKELAAVPKDKRAKKTAPKNEELVQEPIVTSVKKREEILPDNDTVKNIKVIKEQESVDSEQKASSKDTSSVKTDA